MESFLGMQKLSQGELNPTEIISDLIESTKFVDDTSSFKKENLPEMVIEYQAQEPSVKSLGTSKQVEKRLNSNNELINDVVIENTQITKIKCRTAPSEHTGLSNYQAFEIRQFFDGLIKVIHTVENTTDGVTLFPLNLLKQMKQGSLYVDLFLTLCKGEYFGNRTFLLSDLKWSERFMKLCEQSIPAKSVKFFMNSLVGMKPAADNIVVCAVSETFVDTLYFTRSCLLAVINTFTEEIDFPLKDYFASFGLMSEWTSADFAPFCKYITAYPMAKFLDNDLPLTPSGFNLDSILVFGGRLKRRLKARLCTQTSAVGYDTSIGLWQTWLQGIKRGCDKVPNSYVSNAYLKHRKTMEKKTVYSREFMDRFLDHLDEFGSDFSFEKIRLYEPSTSAHYCAPLKNLGGLGYLKRSIFEYPKNQDILDDVKNGFLSHNEACLKHNIRINEMENLVEECSKLTRKVIYHPSNNEVQLLKGLNSFKSDDVDLYREDLKRRYPRHLSVIESDGVMSIDSLLLSGFPQELYLTVETYAILEPLKVRMITKGETIPYWYAKSVQKQMWNYLGTFPQFVLTKEPVKESHLNNLITQEELLEDKYNLKLNFDKIVSGDYSAATDNLKTVYTQAAFEMFLSHYGEWRHSVSGTDIINDEFDKNIFRSVLYNSYVTYPKYTKLEPAIQSCGQLMGSPLSFPILCLVNLIAYRMALEEYLGGIKIPFRELPVLVNGDDIAFRSNDLFYIIWKRCIAEVGFELSVGKNYIHSAVCTINSEVFRFYDRLFHLVKYLNIGLLLGQSKLSVRSSEEVIPLADWYNEVVDGAVHKRIIHNMFLSYHSQRIAVATNDGEYNLFIPTALGGLGFKNIGEIPVIYTSFQRKLATFLKLRIDTFVGSISDFKKECFFRKLKIKVAEKRPNVKDNKEHSFFLYELTGRESSEELEILGAGLLKENIVSHEINLWNTEGLLNSKAPVESVPAYSDPRRILKDFRKSVYEPFTIDRFKSEFIVIILDAVPVEHYVNPIEVYGVNYIQLDIKDPWSIQEELDFWFEPKIDEQPVELVTDYTSKFHLYTAYNHKDISRDRLMEGFSDYIISVKVFGGPDPLDLDNCL
jgi:hypothetical protein